MEVGEDLAGAGAGYAGERRESAIGCDRPVRWERYVGVGGG